MSIIFQKEGGMGMRLSDTVTTHLVYLRIYDIYKLYINTLRYVVYGVLSIDFKEF